MSRIPETELLNMNPEQFQELQDIYNRGKILGSPMSAYEIPWVRINPHQEEVSKSVEITMLHQPTLMPIEEEEVVTQFIKKVCIDANIDENTLIKQQEEINQLRSELSKYKLIEGAFIGGQEVYVREE